MNVPLMVESASQPGTYHLLQKRTDGRLTCSCRGYVFRGLCRHVIGIDPGMGVPPPQQHQPVVKESKPMRPKFSTIRGYDLFEVTSALQKAVRRGDAKMAGYWAIELHESGRSALAWRRMLTMSAEDCADFVTSEIEALYKASHDAKSSGKEPESVFIAKASIILAQAKKSRDADHLAILVWKAKIGLTDEELMADLAAARSERVEIPEEALDCHTMSGKRRGKTKLQFFGDEHDALSPRIPGLFDDVVEQLKARDPVAVKKFTERKKSDTE